MERERNIPELSAEGESKRKIFKRAVTALKGIVKGLSVGSSNENTAQTGGITRRRFLGLH